MTDRSENERPAETPEGERIAKVMARAGLCSRRDAERWIADGRVSVNGRVLDSPACNVTQSDTVTVDGRPIARRERTRLFLFHKPRGTVTTDRDPEGRDTIFDVLPDDLPRLVTIGRLDINTEGLLLLTNDGGLARALELPSTGWLRRYRVRAHGSIDQAQLDALAAGVVIEGVEYRGIEARIDRVQGANVWLTMGLREGKNREIKRVLEHLGLAVNRLIRVSYGPFQLGELEEGAVEEVKTRILKDQLGDNLAAEAGVDFEAPVFDTKDREKIARRHPNEDRPEREERGGERHQARPARGERPRPEGRGDARGDRRGGRSADAGPEKRPLSARDVIPRTRKHVSLMRAEKATREEGGSRRRIERTETADRRGRTVPVERVSGGERDAERAGNRNARRFTSERNGGAGASDGGKRTMRRGAGDNRGRDNRGGEGGEHRAGWRRTEGAGDRPARTGSRPPRGDDRGPRRDRAEGAGRPEGGRRFERSAGGDRAPRRDFGDRPPRKDFGGRPPRKDFGDRPPRKDFADRAPRKDFGDRPPRRDAGDRPPRKDFGDRPPRKDFGDRPPRRDFSDRPPRKDFGDRPPRREFDGDRSAPRGERPGRSFGDKPGGAKPFAGKSFAGKGPGRSGGKPGGGKSFGGKPGGKSFGGKPGGKSFGGKPGGGRSGGPPRSGGKGGRPGGSRGPR